MIDEFYLLKIEIKLPLEENVKEYEEYYKEILYEEVYPDGV